MSLWLTHRPKFYFLSFGDVKKGLGNNMANSLDQWDLLGLFHVCVVEVICHLKQKTEK